MMKTLIAKEVRGNLLSFRFLASFVILFVVVTVTAAVLAGDYARSLDDHSLRQGEVEKYLRSYAHFNRIQNVLRATQPPIPFQTLVRGLTADANIENFDNDPLPVMFPLTDLAFIVTVLMSLVALILSYDAISGEKEEGTLKLMLSSGLPRSRVILAKFAGGVLTIAGPFLVSLAAGMLIILLHPRVAWTGADWGALGLIAAGAVLYVSVFYLIGILVSSAHRTSSSSIMTSLFVWVLLVLVVPNLSPFAAAFLSPTPSRIKVDREIERLTDVDRDDLGRKLEAEARREFVRQYPALAERLTDAALKSRIASDADYLKAYEALRAAVGRAWAEANRIQGAKAQLLEDDLTRKEEAQTGLAQVLSMISPLADFDYLATDLSSTGVRNQEHFAQLRRAWDRAFGDYQTKKIAELKAKDPTADEWNTAIDMTDAPRFRYIEEGLAGRVKAALPPFGVLFGFGIVLFAAAYVAFIRYDVR